MGITLIAFATFDSSLGIYHPMVMIRPHLLIYFVAYFLVVSIALMNLVTAVIVEGSLEQASTDRQVLRKQRALQVKKLMPHIKNLFKLLDEDDSGVVTLQEVQNAPESVQNELMKVINAEDLEEIFHMLDGDHSNSVAIEEFCDGISKIVQSDLSIETLRMMKQIDKSRRQTAELHTFVE